MTSAQEEARGVTNEGSVDVLNHGGATRRLLRRQQRPVRSGGNLFCLSAVQVGKEGERQGKQELPAHSAHGHFSQIPKPAGPTDGG